MPLKKITEQQFLARRKDRRMVLVDAAAAIVGLLLMTASVGGVVVLDPEPVQPEWSVSMFEGKVSVKRCAGGDPGRIGCALVTYNGEQLHELRDRPGAPEGEEVPVGFPDVTTPNVTRVTFTLTWIDNVPDTNHKDHQDRTYRYTEDSRDTLRLRVLTPWGEELDESAMNQMPTVDDVPSGEIKFELNVSEPPEPPSVKAWTSQEAQKGLNETYLDAEHKALGTWGAWVTVVKAGDQNGTLPKNACRGYLPTGNETLGTDDQAYEVPEEAREPVRTQCDTDSMSNNMIENQPASQPAGYHATYDDRGNPWILEMTLWTYSTTVAL